MWENRDTIFDDLATNSDGIENWVIEVRYEFIRNGAFSDDGYYMLQDAKVVEA